ncbi:MAG: DeoR/GlpR family DNA-binding transcription regulator [Bacilli bacterium]
MLSQQRHKMIKDLLDTHRVVKMQTIVETTGASESTIRRDLSQLEEEGVLVRVHGGAQRVQSAREEESFAEKVDHAVTEKVKIAQKASTLVTNGMRIFLDAGTTTMAMIPFLKEKRITVVTNSLPITNTLLEHGVPTYVIGGQLKKSTQALVGYYAREALLNYHFDLVFLGMNAVSVASGYTTPDPDEALVKKVAIERSKEAYVLVDEAKFHADAFCTVCPLHRAKMITCTSDENLLEAFAKETEVLNAQ